MKKTNDPMEIDNMEEETEEELSFEDFKKEGRTTWEWDCLNSLSDIIETLEEQCEELVQNIKKRGEKPPKGTNWVQWWSPHLFNNCKYSLNICNKNMYNKNKK